MIPAKSDACWIRVLKSDSDLAEASLATKLLVSRLRKLVKKDPCEITTAANQLHDDIARHACMVADVKFF